jgi:hypothetical protein
MEHRRIIKKGPVTLATREDGSMDPASASSQGLFLADTRFLSRFQVRLNEVEPLLLGSSEEILFESSYLRTNPPLGNIPAHGIGLLQRNTIEVGMVRIQLTVSNWTLLPLEFELSIEVDADFFDSFEARGVRRLQRGELEDPFATERTIELRYLGLDDVTRITHISVDPPMTRFDDGWMYWAMTLEVAERKELELQITMVEEAPDGAYPVPSAAMAEASKPPWFDDATTISVSSGAAQAIVRRSLDDLQVLLTEYEGVWVPMAGLLRFAVPFGRDCCAVDQPVRGPR